MDKETLRKLSNLKKKKKSLYLNFKVDLGLSVKSLVNAPNSKIKPKIRNITVLGDF